MTVFMEYISTSLYILISVVFFEVDPLFIAASFVVNVREDIL